MRPRAGGDAQNCWPPLFCPLGYCPRFGATGLAGAAGITGADIGAGFAGGTAPDGAAGALGADGSVGLAGKTALCVTVLPDPKMLPVKRRVEA